MIKNRKKALKHQMKRQGLLTGNQTPATPNPKPVVSQAKLSLEEFMAIDAVSGIRANLVETLYNEGIQTSADFGQWAEKDLLALKGIGPATVKKLKENGVTFNS